MIITDITLIDSMAELIFSDKPNFIMVDTNDYNRLMSCYNYIIATNVQVPFIVKQV